eukprot:8798721-Pyramimonas_sp.AAC.1
MIALPKGVHLPPRFVAREPPGRRRGGRGAGPRRRRAPLRHPELPDADRVLLELPRLAHALTFQEG